MKNFILRLRMGIAFLGLIKDPAKTENVFKLSDDARALKGPLLQQTVDYIEKIPGFSELYEKRYEPKVLKIDELLAFPKGSLGNSLGTHLKENNLDINFFPVSKEDSEINYMLKRARRNHDIWHILTGFDTSVAGEAGLQAFTYAQLRAPFSGLLMAGTILHGLNRGQESFHDIMGNIFIGYQMGKKCKPLIGIPLESRFADNLAALKTELFLN